MTGLQRNAVYIYIYITELGRDKEDHGSFVLISRGSSLSSVFLLLHLAINDCVFIASDRIGWRRVARGERVEEWRVMQFDAITFPLSFLLLSRLFYS